MLGALDAPVYTVAENVLLGHQHQAVRGQYGTARQRPDDDLDLLYRGALFVEPGGLKRREPRAACNALVTQQRDQAVRLCLCTRREKNTQPGLAPVPHAPP